MSKRGKIVKEEYDYATNKIMQWYDKKIKTLSIISPPYNEGNIFIDIINKVINTNGRVLYVWNGMKVHKDILFDIKQKNKNITSSFISSGDSSSNLVFTNTNLIENVTGEFDLVIFDDVSAYSKISRQEIAIKHMWLTHITKKIILYTIEKTINIGEFMELTYIHKKNPFTEPRLITTKVNLENDIPYILYDYLRWFMDNNQSTIILVPNKEKLEAVFEFYSTKLKFKNTKMYIADEDNFEKNIINSDLKIKDKSIIIITDNIDFSIINFKFVNIVVLFADDRKFTYKKLLYLCGKACKTNEMIPEVLLVAREASEEIDIARNFARDFNKKVWERNYSGYLKK